MTTVQPAPFPALRGHQYALLTTFRKSGQPVPTPVWFAEDGGMIYVYTRAEAGKVKRIRAGGRVELAPCDARGTLLGPAAAGGARLLAPAEYARAEQLFVRKYKLLFRVFTFIGGLQKARAAYIEIAPA